jgi:anti-sigma regulatory factor (Ser/Thr protein kinase)
MTTCMKAPMTDVTARPCSAAGTHGHPALRQSVRMVHHRRCPTDPPPGRPLRAVLDLGAVPTAPGCARAWTRQILWEWRLAGLSATAEVIVSELTTNAVLASRREGCPFIRLILAFDGDEPAILVRDYCPGIPQLRDAGADDEDGRGMLLVQAMSNRSGWYPVGDGTLGKVVWAVGFPG